jgi:hypothetical protein
LSSQFLEFAEKSVKEDHGWFFEYPIAGPRTTRPGYPAGGRQKIEGFRHRKNQAGVLHNQDIDLW